MKRIFATFVSCLVLLSATVKTPALAEVKDEAEQSNVSVFQDALTTAADGIYSVIDGVKTNIAELFDASDHLVLEDSESADAPMSASVQDTENAAVIPSNVDGVVWDTGYTTCTLQSGATVDGQALRPEISRHTSTLTTFKAEPNTHLTGSAYYLFSRFLKLATVDLADSFDTSQVTNMSGMFENCTDLASLTLPDGFDTSSVEDMSYMFSGCSRLASLSLPDSFSTSSVERMTYMFSGCSNLASLTLPEVFDTGSVESMTYMFSGCSALTSLTLPDSFNTGSVESMTSMFRNCSLLISLTLPEAFDTHAVENMNNMFKGCSALTSLTLPQNFVTTNANTDNMFDVKDQASGTFALHSLTLPKNFTMQAGTGLPGLATQGSTKYYWTTSIDSCVNYGTTDDEAVENMNTALAASADSVTFTAVNVALGLDANGGTYNSNADALEDSVQNANEVKTLFGDTNEVIDAANLPTPTLTDATFIGWSAEREGEVLPTPLIFPASDSTYYAQYIEEPGPTPGPTPEPTPEPTPDVVPAADADALPLTGDTSAALTSAVVAVLMGTLALSTAGYGLYRKRLQ